MELRSSAFEQGKEIPRKYTADGENVSPPLEWSRPPPGTKELVLLVEDPDAPGPEPFIHWVMYKIPPEQRGLPEGVRHADDPATGGALQGVNSFAKTGYGGPAPPRGRPHHYHFRLLALNRELVPEPDLDKHALLDYTRGHVVGTAELLGTYRRPPL